MESSSILQDLNLKKDKFENKITRLKEEIEAFEDLKDQFPNIQFKIEQLHHIKVKKLISCCQD